MKKIIIFLISTVVLAVGAVSCSDDKVSSTSIFIDSDETWNEFDEWLEYNYRLPYNISFKYKMEDIESNTEYNLVPADYMKSAQMAKLIKFLFLDVYDEIAGVDFTRSYVPKVFHCIGSAAYNPSQNTMVLATAEGGLKITIYYINNLDPYNVASLNYYYFNTIHHEFFHILHQTKDYQQEFKTISAENYLSSSSWNNGTEAAASSLGFVSKYARASYNEDFVETMSRYLTRTEAEWDAWLAQGSAEGTAIIYRKLQLCREYMADTWNIDLDNLREIVQRRQTELHEIDFDNI
ncbi:MAG: putative zinc-binding metallopeptidase [Alistipes sp.]|nr:putative zinc-binding metallopeptidase [Alistipes sp.]